MLGYKVLFLLFLLFSWLTLVHADKPNFEISTPGDAPTTSSDDDTSSGAPDVKLLNTPTDTSDAINDKLLMNGLDGNSKLNGDIVVVVVNLNDQVATDSTDSTGSTDAPDSSPHIGKDNSDVAFNITNASDTDTVTTSTVTVHDTVTTTVTTSKQDVPSSNAKDKKADPTDTPSPGPKNKDSDTDSNPDLPKDWRDQMLTSVNKIRAEAGMPPLKIDERANKMAQKHSDYQDSIHKMTHKGPDSGLDERADKAGFKGQYSALAANVAWNQRSVKQAMKSWRDSPEHYKNMIGDYNVCGFGEKNWYWTQEFLKLKE